MNVAIVVFKIFVLVVFVAYECRLAIVYLKIFVLVVFVAYEDCFIAIDSFSCFRRL